MQKNSLILTAVLVVVLIAVSAMACTSTFKPASAEVTSVTTDKPLYHSNEVMMLKVLVNSTGYTNDTYLKIEGIMDSYGQTRLSHVIQANLTPGTNMFPYDFHLPSCSKCSGLDPGVYPVNVTLAKNGTIISNLSVMVSLEQ